MAESAAFAKVDVANRRWNSRNQIDAQALQQRSHYEAAEATIGNHNIPFDQARKHLGRQADVTLKAMARDTVQHCACRNAEQRDNFHNGKACTPALRVGLWKGLLIGTGIRQANA